MNDTPEPRTPRTASPRCFLMCPPTFFDVTYSINPWMDVHQHVDTSLAYDQWAGLVLAYRRAGHQVFLLDPAPGLPDAVFAANGATVVDGNTLLARFAHPERAHEALLHRSWHQRNHHVYNGQSLTEPHHINEGEGDYAVTAHTLLAGYGFRTTRTAHPEVAALSTRALLSLELVDDRFYHLDVALTVLDPTTNHIAYYPPAFSPASRQQLAARFPHALIATETDALAFGLNAVSDGYHVFLPPGAPELTTQLRTAGYSPRLLDTSELIKGGGSVKCCTQELRPGPTRTA